jgi:Zn-finger nucleic acid-binding protein
MICPKCLSTMEAVRFEEIEVDRCTNCRGIWFDLLEEERLKELEGSRCIDVGPRELGRRYDEIREIECPRCHTPLIKMVEASQTHLRYESCTVCHGLFFDAGEFTDFTDESIGDSLRYWFAQRRQP